MNAAQLDEAIWRWIQSQQGWQDASSHAQIKITPGQVEMAQLTSLGLAGWVVLDWQARGLGLSLKKPARTTSQSIIPVHVIDRLEAPVLTIHIQVIIAPAADWDDASDPESLVPDLKRVIDQGRARTLSVSAQRTGPAQDWQVVSARQPPDDTPMELT
jgi:hypothetical protein